MTETAATTGAPSADSLPRDEVPAGGGPGERDDGGALRVEEFRGAAADWDAFVRGQRGWTHYHLHGWGRVIREVHGHPCLRLAARDEDDRLAGVLPLVRVKSPLFGHFLVSMPYLNYGGPLGEAAAVRDLTRAAGHLARGEDADLLELRSRVELPVELPASHRKVGVLLDLPESGDPEELWEGFDSGVRNQVRKPKKKGAEVRFGPDQLGPFFEVFSRHMRDLGTPTQPRALFEAIHQTFPDDVWFGCAWLDGRPVACGAGLRWDGEFEMVWASALFEYRSTAANMLLYWRFIERAVEEGLETFNFGRCTPGSGTHNFKQQWGTRDETLWWHQQTEDLEATPSPEDDAYAWGPEIWRRLPLGVANRLGPRVVRYIP